MGFAQGAKITSDIVDEIVNGLIATGAWHNVDTTWNSTLKTQNDSRHVLIYGAAGAAGKGNTTLSAAVSIGNSTISVADSTNFNVGDKVVYLKPCDRNYLWNVTTKKGKRKKDVDITDTIQNKITENNSKIK